MLAAGAPPRLLQSTHQAALDEVRHARLTFSLASAYAGRPLAAGQFPEAVEPMRSRSPRDRAGWLSALAVESFQDGILGEGVAVQAAQAAQLQAQDPAVLRVLAVIAKDESRHAELAWEILDWCLAEGGDPVAEALAEVLSRQPAPAPAGLEPDDGPGATLAAHGRLPEAAIQALARRLHAEALQRLASAPRLQARRQPAAVL